MPVSNKQHRLLLEHLKGCVEGNADTFFDPGCVHWLDKNITMNYQRLPDNQLIETHEIEYSLLEELVEGLEDEEDGEEVPDVEEAEKVFVPILKQYPWITENARKMAKMIYKDKYKTDEELIEVSDEDSDLDDDVDTSQYEMYWETVSKMVVQAIQHELNSKFYMSQ